MARTAATKQPTGGVKRLRPMDCFAALEMTDLAPPPLDDLSVGGSKPDIGGEVTNVGEFFTPKSDDENDLAPGPPRQEVGDAIQTDHVELAGVGTAVVGPAPRFSQSVRHFWKSVCRSGAGFPRDSSSRER